MALGLVLVLVLFGIFSVFSKQYRREPEIVFSEFIGAVERGGVREVVIQGQNIQGKYKNGEQFRTFAPDDPELVKTLRAKDVKIAAKPEDESSWYMVLLLNWFPMLLLLGVWIFFMRQMQVGGGKAMSFGKSRAKLLTENQHRVTFSDVAGVDEAKDDLQEIIAFLKDPKKFTKLGGRIPKGCLLVGPPGTGKTLLARACAGEAGVPFFSISGSDFVEMFVGVGASRVRDLFVQGKRQAPCIIFIDEIDAVGRHRGAGLGGGHDEREQTLNQLLVEMDGFDARGGVILIAATNPPDILHPALLRPRRLDRPIPGSPPDPTRRRQNPQGHAQGQPQAPRAGGHALVVPEDDRGLMTRSEMIARLVFALGGRSAEELVFHEPTTGASSDIEQATKIARAMVTEYGMSAKLGAVKYGQEHGDPFLRRSMGHAPDYSLEVAHAIDEEVRALIEAAHTEAWDVLNTYRDVLDNLVVELLDKETLTRKDLAR